MGDWACPVSVGVAQHEYIGPRTGLVARQLTRGARRNDVGGGRYRGSDSTTLVPAPGALVTASAAPIVSARSAIVASPR